MDNFKLARRSILDISHLTVTSIQDEADAVFSVQLEFGKSSLILALRRVSMVETLAKKRRLPKSS